MIDKDTYLNILKQITPPTKLIAVSKTKPAEDILALYQLGQRDFGENKVQELIEKQAVLPKDIRWHLIGHLQTNKVKQVLPYVYMIHSIDSFKLMQEIEKNAIKLNIPKVKCLIQLHIADEASKSGFEKSELNSDFIKLAKSKDHIEFCGMMGIGTNTDNETKIHAEFNEINHIFLSLKNEFGPSFTELSIGMSGDYMLAMAHGSTYVRIGSLLFGARNYT